MEELTKAINRSHDTAVGPDDIHSQFFKNVSSIFVPTFKTCLVYLDIREYFTSWKEATNYSHPESRKRSQ